MANVGSIASVTFVTTPSAPRLTTTPWKVLPSFSRERFSTSPFGRDDLQGSDGGREVPVLHAGTMRRRRARTGDGDVGQGREVVQREPLLVERGAQLAVAHARLDGYRARCGIQRDDAIHLTEREEIDGAVGDPVEAVPRAEHLEPGMLLHVRPAPVRTDVAAVQTVGAVSVVARPVDQRAVHRGADLRPGRACTSPRRR